MTDIAISVTVNTESLDATIARYEHINAVIAKYADLIAVRARQIVPVKTGALRASITVALTEMAAEISAGDGLTYASIIEYGGATRAAKPFIRPSVEAYRDAFLSEIAAIIGGV